MKVGIAGAGTMGQGIAQLAATAGAEVSVFDRIPSAVASLVPSVERLLKRRVEKGQIAKGDSAKILSRLKTVTSLEKFSECDLVIEAVTEDLAVKTALLSEIEKHVSPECLISSNTSSLSLTSIAAACKLPERVVGIHFFNPAPLMPLVEIVEAVQSSAESVKSGEELVRAWGKTPIRVKDTPAFVVNRIARPYYGEALRLLEERIADPATIDWAMTHFGQFRMGPFELMDFIGIDVNYAVTESVFAAFYYEPRFRPSLTQKRLVEAGRLGRKSGRGFYSYEEGAERPAPKTDTDLGSKIFTRILSLLINEAIDAVYWGVAEPAAIDQAMTLGMNYPKGLLRWGEEIGLERVLMELERLQHDYGEERYRPSILLRRMVQGGNSFFGKAC